MPTTAARTLTVSATGAALANLGEILGTALTETAGLLAGGFKKFFNIATPAATMDHLVLVDTVTTATTATTVTTVTGLTASNLDTTVSSRLASASYTAPPSAATIAAAVWATTIEGAYTAIQYMRIALATLGGKLSGAGTGTEKIRDTGDTKDRVTATVDTSGNRTAVTLDGS